MECHRLHDLLGDLQWIKQSERGYRLRSEDVVIDKDFVFAVE